MSKLCLGYWHCQCNDKLSVSCWKPVTFAFKRIIEINVVLYIAPNSWSRRSTLEFVAWIQDTRKGFASWPNWVRVSQVLLYIAFMSRAFWNIQRSFNSSGENLIAKFDFQMMLLDIAPQLVCHIFSQIGTVESAVCEIPFAELPSHYRWRYLTGVGFRIIVWAAVSRIVWDFIHSTPLLGLKQFSNESSLNFGAWGVPATTMEILALLH